MNEKQIPEEIAAIIEAKRQALIAERKAKEEAEARQRAEAEAIGQAKWDEYIQAAMPKVPEFLRPYVDLSLVKPDFLRIGKGWDHPKNEEIPISVPGLALITFDPKAGTWRPEEANWHENWDSDPRFEWGDRTQDLPLALGKAKLAMAEHQEYQARRAAQVEEAKKMVEEYERDEAKREAQAAELEEMEQEEQARKEREEEILFDVLRNDAVALWLVKAYLLIQKERVNFSERIESLNDSMYWSEERWSSRAAELRHQAEEADRRASEERSRASRLEDDLDDAEKKLKRAERGW